MKSQLLFLLLVILLASPASGRAGDSTGGQAWSSIWRATEVSTLWYLSYGWGEEGGAPFNRESIGRGYVTLKLKPVEWFQPRATMDAHQDETGDFKIRLKYMYAKFVIPVETCVISEPNIEFGLVHGPWFDYEEHINYYRMQGTMLIERNKTLNSADAGFTIAGLLGKKLPKEYQEQVNPKYPGKYGSFAFGVYNGGGYHAKEYNQNKVFESRLSVRPLGFVFPNLSLSHFFIFGKGNVASEPDWILNAFMASVEHQYFTLTGQFATGEGNQKGDKVDANGDSLESQGYSGFLEIKLPWINSTIIGRYDHWKWGQDASDRIIAGIAYHFMPYNFFLLDMDYVIHQDDATPDDWQVKLTLQVHVP